MSYGTEGRVLGPTVGCWCETSDDFDLLIELIAHALADKETSMLQVAHDQAVARQRQKLACSCVLSLSARQSLGMALDRPPPFPLFSSPFPL